MTSNERKNHEKIARPTLGKFARNEFAFVGTNCGAIQKLAVEITRVLSQKWNVAYLDTAHPKGENLPELSPFLAAGATLDCLDEIQNYQFFIQKRLETHQFRQLFNGNDLVLVNGNHHAAAAQVVIIDPKKENSLRKRLTELTNIRLILLADGVEKPFGFLGNLATIPQLSMNNLPEIIQFFEQEMREKTPPIFGLVLAGGRSVRMGRDKGAIEWHGRPQRDFLVDLLAPFCEEVWISARSEQDFSTETSAKILPDSFLNLGPTGAILSAFQKNPNVAWLVVACDLPLLDAATIEFLIKNRDPKNIATAFRNPETGWTEPLITIWESKSYAILLNFLAQGISCPRKVLMNSETCVLEAPIAAVLRNVNTPAEAFLLKIE
jgi:molybdenum cofactor guanylyltransferase